MLRTILKTLSVLAVVSGLLEVQAAHAGLRHRSGSSGGGWGSNGSSGGWGSSGGSSGTTPAPAAPAIGNPFNAPADPAPAAPPAPEETYHPTYGPLRSDALLAVKVPADAKVFVNDLPTPSRGENRQFFSRNLQSGLHYNYTVRVERVRDCMVISESKTVQLTAGQSANLDFSHGEAQAQTVATSRRLSGDGAKSNGLLCEYVPTVQSTPCDEVKQAVIEKNGEQQVGEQTVSGEGSGQESAERRAEPISLNRRGNSSIWLMMLSLGGASLVVFCWSKLQAGRTVLRAWPKPGVRSQSI